MSTTKQRVAKRMTSAARVIGYGATVVLLSVKLLSMAFQAGLWASDILFFVYLGISLAGCIVSWWRKWLAGTLLVSVSFALGNYLGLSSPWGIAALVTWSPQFGLPFLVAGVLFLISSWLSRPWLGRSWLPQRVYVLLGTVLAFWVVPFLSLLCVEFIGGVAIFFPSLHTKEVAVEVGDGWVKSDPAPRGHYNYINFKINNVGSETHMLIVLQTSLDPGSFPVENGQVRGYAYIDEEWSTVGVPTYPFKAEEVPSGVLPPKPKPMSGVLIAPGHTAVVRYGYMQRSDSGTVLVLFCNYPSHYERDEYTMLTTQ